MEFIALKNMTKRMDIKKGVPLYSNSTAVLQPLLTLKSNTMKNTVQRYGLSGNLQVFQPKIHIL